jgi:hypothetical protein
MATERRSKATEAQIAVHWKEEEYVRPAPDSSDWSTPRSWSGSQRSFGGELRFLLRQASALKVVFE